MTIGSEVSAAAGQPVTNEPIAVVGMACRLPGAADLRAFAALLTGGVDAITDIPENRRSALPGAGPAADAVSRGGFLDGVDRFDAAFFGISPREAAAMDPQQRLVLELAWESFEDAGMAPARFRARQAGVFVGAIADDYAALVRAGGAEAFTPHTATGLQRGIIANRVSYALGLRGPSLTVDSGQSSSLVAVHLAAESLRRGECEVALAGGVHLNLAPEGNLAISKLGALSPDGRCFTFDARGNGFVRGEGGAVIVLKPLSAALADGDRVHCLLAGSAVNNDGGGANLTAPDQRAQEEVLRLAHQRAGTAPSDLAYVELHGTGTPLGDPVEAAALGAVLGRARGAGSPLPVGSVKTNIGHLEGAAGIAGLVKTALCLRDGVLVPSLNFETPNPAISLEETNLRVQVRLEPIGGDGAPGAAGVSSFGMGGTNCHVVLTRWEPGRDAAPVPAGNPESAVLESSALAWVVSGRSEAALREQAARLADSVGAAADAARPEDVAWSLAVSRGMFEHRAVVLGAGSGELLGGLRAVAVGGGGGGVVRGVVGGDSRVVLVFPGQGSQWVGMGWELWGSSVVFGESMAACERALAPFVEWSLRDVLGGVAGAPGLERVDVVQPVLWAVMVSLAALWRSLGVEPAAVVGHSQGEIAAAVVAGGLSLEDGARVVAVRSRLIAGRLSGLGGMVSVGASRALVEELLADSGGGVSVAAVNGPASVVVSGEPGALEALMVRCEERGVRARRIAVDYASHSAQVELLEAELLEALAPVRPRSSGVSFFSTVTGEWVDTAVLDAGYWYRNLRQPVLFEPVVRGLLESGFGVFVEASPHPVLTVGIQESIDATDRDAVVLGSLRRDEGGSERFLNSLAEAHVHGVAVDWAKVLGGREARLVDLPGYAFQRRSHWLAPATGAASPPSAGGTPVSGTPVTDGLAEAAAPDGDGDADEDAFALLRRSLLGLAPAEQRRRCLDLVCAEAAAVLGYGGTADVRATSTFRDLGFDSTMSVELRNRVGAALGRRLPSTLLFDRPTPTAVADHVRDLLLGTGDRLLTPVSVPVQDEPIVIVAMGCRLPGGVTTPEELWQLLVEEGDAISGFPGDRGWDLEDLARPAGEDGGPIPQAGGFLYDAAEFDAAFFGISPREAAAMDPQQRLLLETSWEAIERAGVDPASLHGDWVGVFVGAMAQEYGPRLYQRSEEARGYLLTGGATSVLSGRLSYALGLEGPAVTVDTACSSSLVALHLAAQSLRSGECSLALAAGVTVMSSPGIFVEFSRQNGLSADGRCRAFAAGADGTGWGEGVGVVVLERLSDARRNGHPVLAVVRGSAVNQDGASNGLTAPNGPSQQRVIRQALASAGLSAAEVDVVEAHGTGTTLGDPIEAQALLATYGQDRPEDRPLWLGSLKSNVGHTQAAAGVAGVMKMVLAMQHGVLPKTLHVDEPSPQVDWSAGAVELLAEAQAWPEDRPRRAGVSSFGISGTNAHVILEQAPEAEPVEVETVPVALGGEVVPLVVSGRSEAGLREQAARLVGVLERSGVRPVDVAWSLASGRSRFEERAVVVGASAAELLEGLAALADGARTGVAVRGRVVQDGRVVFVFPGQGSQWVGMGWELWGSSVVFGESMAACERALAPFVEWSLRDVVGAGEEDPRWERVDVVQPVLWAVMVSLAALWRSLGVEPAAVVGHSQGEVAAAVVAGALSLEDGARIVAVRSRLVAGRLSGLGGMVSVSAPRALVEELLADSAGGVSVAAVNGPASVVVSGEPGALEALMAGCEERGVRARRIAVDYASHSAQVELLEAELLEALAPVRPRSSGVAFHSTVTGERIDTAVMDAGYWYRNLRETVQFESVVRGLMRQGHGVFVEASPHPVLMVGMQECAESVDLDAVVLGSLRRGEGGVGRLLTSLAEAFVRGVEVDWGSVLDGRGGQWVDLPTYAFQRERFWLETSGLGVVSGVSSGGGDGGFWEVVERGDVGGLAGLLGVGDGVDLGGVMPALSSWRERSRESAVVDGWRYRVVWRPVASGSSVRVSGVWLVVVGAGVEDGGWGEALTGVLAGAGVEVRSVVVGAGEGRE
ncbi:type I polyketide synthase, partial [Kitasatospora sp. NPDC008115]|uniref:type I polyketide synthase n=1 Tax=Kitasatospora sp. NPDC008115 TaxID=3364022 RepID=UPI0036EE1296